jgi:hypothetical protein
VIEMAIDSGVRWNGSPKNSGAVSSIGESKLKAREDQLAAREVAAAEYASARSAVEENMVRLRALRLARDSTPAIAPMQPAKAVRAKKRKRPGASASTVATES